jgi:hypothetical protein
MSQYMLHLFIGIQHDAVNRIVHQARWQRNPQLTALSLVQNPPAQASFKHMQFGFAHRAFEPEQKPVVKVGWIVKPIFVQDQGAA